MVAVPLRPPSRMVIAGSPAYFPLRLISIHRYGWRRPGGRGFGRDRLSLTSNMESKLPPRAPNLVPHEVNFANGMVHYDISLSHAGIIDGALMSLRWGDRMRFAFAAALVMFLASATAAPSFAGPSADIRSLENDFNAAYAANDLDKYFGYYADDAILWFPEGRTNVPAYRKEWTDYIHSGARLEQAALSDLHLRPSPRGDSVIASYLLHVRTREPGKAVTDEDFQETDVRFKTPAGWKIAHVHYAPAPKNTKP